MKDSDIPREAKCSWRLSSDVGVHWSQGSPAHYSGTLRCSRLWTCPVCSAVIRQGRAVEIQTGADWHVGEGNTAVLAALTMSHARTDPLAVTLGALYAAWDLMVKRRPWKALKAAQGVVGYIRAVEITWGPANGWHPHLHVLLFLSGHVDDAQLGRLEIEIFTLWLRYVVESGGRAPSAMHGVRVSRGVAGYIAKVQEHDDQGATVGLEMARSDVKVGRGGNLAPFELLDHDESWARTLWLEYAAVTKGRRAIEWSRGLKAATGVLDRTDQEVIDDTESAALVMVMAGQFYDSLQRDGELADFLEVVEDAGEQGKILDLVAMVQSYDPETVAT